MGIYAMVKPDRPVVDAIHGKAIDLANDLDRDWFDSHPERNFCLRGVMPFETNGPIESPPAGQTWRMLVVRLKPGVRSRLLLGLPTEAPNDSATDDDLRPIFNAIAPPQLRQMVEPLHANMGVK